MAGSERRKALDGLDPTVAELLKDRQGERKRPRYRSEAERVKATFDLAPETLERVRAAAAELRVAQYRLVEKLLIEGLDRWEAGELDLKTVAVATTWGFE